MNKHLTKIIILTLFLVANFSLANSTLAASTKLDFTEKNIGVGEQFYVDLMLDTEGESVNTIEGNITFQNDNLSLVRFEDGKSMVNLWVKKPTLDSDGNTLSFAGIMTNGFSGVIDPFNPDYKLPGPIIRLILVGKKPGTASLSTSVLNLNLNDGKGTPITAPAFYDTVKIDNFVNNQKYENKGDSSPSLDAYIVREPDLYDNKYVLIFNATDKASGIKSVSVKEGKRDWVKIASPYLLKDQSRRSTIYIQAANYLGVSVVETIEPLPEKLFTVSHIIIFLIVLLLLLTIIIILCKKYKKKHV